MTSIVQKLLALFVALLTVAPLAHRLHKRGAFAPLVQKWRGLSRGVQSMAFAVFLVLFAYATDKQLGGMIGEGLRSLPPTVATLCTNAFSSIARLTGYSVSSVATNETHDFTMPEGARLAELIARRGAHDDGFWLFDSFTNNIAAENPVWIQTDGTVTVKSPAPGIPIEELALYTTYSNITVYAPLQGSYGFLPASRWPDFFPSRIWTAVTDDGTRVITWENALIDRDPATPVSFQAEFRENGDVIYRYSPTPPPPHSSTSIGLFHNGTAPLLHSHTHNSSTPLATNDYPLTTIHWSYIGDLSDGSGDYDGDGLTDWQEIMQTRTDPRRADTDGDGLADYVEVNGGTSPLNPDTDGDGFPDGWDAARYQSHRLLNAQDTDRPVMISLVTETPRENRAVLMIGDLPILLNATNTWSFNMPTGTSWNVELVTAGREVQLAIDAGEGVFVDNGDGIFARCTSAYDQPGPPMRGGGGDSGGSRGGTGAIHAPCIFLEPSMQVIHRGESALVTALRIPSAATLGIRPNWSFDPSYMASHVSVSADGMSATVSALGDGWLSSVTLHASVGANPPEGLAGSAIVALCDGQVTMSLDAILSAGHTNATITTTFGGCDHHADNDELLLEVEAGRHTSDGWQHLAWIDTDPETPGLQRRTPVSRHSPQQLDWNMRAAVSAPLANGADSHVYDANTTFARALPAVSAGQFIPPPFVTIVARAYGGDDALVAESSTTVAIPQYVQITWDAAVLEEFRQPIVFDYPGEEGDIPPPTNVTIFAGCSVQEAASAFAGIAGKVQAIFPSDANIVVVGPEVNVPQPHKTVVIQTGKYIYPSNGLESDDLGRTPIEHCHQRNDSPLGTAYVYGGTIREYIFNQFQSFYLDPPPIDIKNDWRNVPLPLSTSMLTEVFAQVAMHESCHAMGLVPTASADENGHNKCDYGEHYLDRGGTKTLPMRLGFDLWHIQRWKQENADYLRFVFPKGL